MFRRSLQLTSRKWMISAIVCAILTQTAAIAQTTPPAKGLKPILDYIGTAWDTLTRSMTDCRSLIDPKIKASPVLYLPAGMAEPPAVHKLASECNVRVEHLPLAIHHLGEIDTSKIQPHGLLYLENKYVVPGGRFNEMYGWDSYFIVRGLLRAQRVELARGMVDNFFFEIENYGAMLNANRTYYLTRSQPPFLSSMFVDVYDALQKSGHKDPAWLAKAYADLEKDYEMWNREPHRAGDTGLSRYYDFGEGPPAEAVQDETGFYRKVATYFFFHAAQADNYIQENLPGAEKSVAGSLYSQQVCDVPATMARAECEKLREFKLSSDYYKGDRWSVWRGDASLRARVSEQFALQDGKRFGTNQPLAGPFGRGGKVEQASRRAEEADYALSVGREVRMVFRLQPADRGALVLSLRNDFLSALGWARDA
jgi:alpha,alpha-trehalase